MKQIFFYTLAGVLILGVSAEAKKGQEKPPIIAKPMTENAGNKSFLTETIENPFSQGAVLLLRPKQHQCINERQRARLHRNPAGTGGTTNDLLGADAGGA